MTARKGDYIVKGVKGELYPVKPDIFEATYGSVDAQKDWRAAVTEANDLLNDVIGLEAAGDMEVPEHPFARILCAADELGSVEDWMTTETDDEQPPRSVGAAARAAPPPFDIETHKATFVNYSEVRIDEGGTPHYAVPSHQERLVRKLMRLRGFVEQGQARDVLPACGCMDALCEMTRCAAVWNDCALGRCNARQRLALRRLKEAGLHRGGMPRERSEG